jgi:hypothetical protein
MSKTTPVRWWRDDADRFKSRPPYVAPRSEGTHGIDFALFLADNDPKIAAMVRYRIALAERLLSSGLSPMLLSIEPRHSMSLGLARMQSEWLRPPRFVQSSASDRFGRPEMRFSSRMIAPPGLGMFLHDEWLPRRRPLATWPRTLELKSVDNVNRRG